MSIINAGKINSYLDVRYNNNKIETILDKALQLKGLENNEIAALLNLEDEISIQKLFKAAKTVKEKIFGPKTKSYAPLYLSNHCCNNCLYCGFRHGNKNLKRELLSADQAIKKTRKFVKAGHKRAMLVAGEDFKMASLDYTRQIVEEIRLDNDKIKLDLNLAPLSVEQFKEVSSWGIGTYHSFQESYHPAAYKRMHRTGPKADYKHRIQVWDRAIEGGIKDFGMGVLFGLYDCRFEVLAITEHAKYLVDKYGIGPHTISVPRIEPQEGSDVSKLPPYQILDEQFKKVIAVLRLALPHTEMILTTKETPEIKRMALELGITGALADLEEQILAQVI